MANPKSYEREKNGIRFKPGGMNTVESLDQLKEGEYAYLQNVRGYLQGRIVGRATQSTPVETLGLGHPAQTIARLNDTTPDGPAGGFTLISSDITGIVFAGSTNVASGLSGDPTSMVPFRPNTSVQPWMYIGDSAPYPNVIVDSGFHCAGMIKVRSDGLSRKMGVMEPQVAPDVSTGATSIPISGTLEATSPPWTNHSGANPDYDYSQTTNPGTGGVGSPFLIDLPAGSQSVDLTVSGTAFINGLAGVAPGDAGPNAAAFPGFFLTSPPIVIGAFTDGAGNVLPPPAGAVPFVIGVGAGGTFPVPSGAVQLQLGIDSQDPNSGTPSFATNTGSFSVTGAVNVSSVATVPSTIGNVTAYVWGDSPHSGGVASYLWKNPSDGGSGIPRSIGSAPVVTTNNSWQIETAGSAGSPTTAFEWDQLSSGGSVTGDIPLFPSPFTTSPNSPTNTLYANFNVCLVGTIFFPAGGMYTLTLQYKDQIMLGIGGGVTAVYSGGDAPAPSSPVGTSGQMISVASSLPLVFVSEGAGEASFQTTSLTINVPTGGGLFQFEIDWDYWTRAGGSLVMTLNGAVIPPLPSGTRTNVSYAYTFRASESGATSNPSPASTPSITPVLNNVVTPTYSPDPQVDKVDFYRQDEGLANYTYVGTGPNTNPPTPIIDSLTDLAVANNPILVYSNFEPFPSIDLPAGGTCDVSGGVITALTGAFNTRWLPGTIILIGAPPPFGEPLVPQVAYTFIARPTSTTEVTIPGVPDGADLLWNIAEPALAAQPMPSLWGPTDNSSYMFGCGDPLRPGTLYYTAGNNPDSAPDTNQIEVTSPSEILMGGYIIGGIGQVFSTERSWWIYPTFVTALATVSGVEGQAFNLIESVTERGLFIRNCCCTQAGTNGFFRAKDGIYISPAGSGSKSITDSQIYNLFPHESPDGIFSAPTPVVIGSFTVWPPDDTKPSAQKLNFSRGYLYYDYEDVNGFQRTLVYDPVAKGWSVDIGSPAFTTHADGQGPVNELYVGVLDGTIRTLNGGGGEAALSVVATGAMNAGEDRAFKRVGDVFFKAVANTGSDIGVAFYANQYQTSLSGYSPLGLTGSGLLSPYVVDFTSGRGNDLIDIAAVLSWLTNSANAIELWQPDFIPLPPTIQDQPTDWGDLGSPAANFVHGLILEADTFGAAKAIAVEDEFHTLHSPAEGPLTLLGQQKIGLSFNPPFVSHIGRIVSTDGVPWRRGPEQGWTIEWLSDPYPEAGIAWQTELTDLGGEGWQHMMYINIEYLSTANALLTFMIDSGNGSIAPTPLTIPSSSGIQTKLEMKVSPNKWKLLGFQIISSSVMRIFNEGIEVRVKSWDSNGPYRRVRPFGGPSRASAAI